MLRTAGPHRIAAAAAATLAAPPSLDGNTSPVVTARAATAHTCLGAGLPSTEVAWALACRRETVTRHRRRPLPDRVLRAVALRLALEERLAAVGPPRV